MASTSDRKFDKQECIISSTSFIKSIGLGFWWFWYVVWAVLVQPIFWNDVDVFFATSSCLRLSQPYFFPPVPFATSISSISHLFNFVSTSKSPLTESLIKLIQWIPFTFFSVFLYINLFCYLIFPAKLKRLSETHPDGIHQQLIHLRRSQSQQEDRRLLCDCETKREVPCFIQQSDEPKHCYRSVLRACKPSDVLQRCFTRPTRSRVEVSSDSLMGGSKYMHENLDWTRDAPYRRRGLSTSLASLSIFVFNRVFDLILVVQIYSPSLAFGRSY